MKEHTNLSDLFWKVESFIEKGKLDEASIKELVEEKYDKYGIDYEELFIVKVNYIGEFNLTEFVIAYSYRFKYSCWDNR